MNTTGNPVAACKLRGNGRRIAACDGIDGVKDGVSKIRRA
jgi:hypothetical protein